MTDIANTCMCVYWKTQNFSGNYFFLPLGKRAVHEGR